MALHVTRLVRACYRRMQRWLPSHNNRCIQQRRCYPPGQINSEYAELRLVDMKIRGRLDKQPASLLLINLCGEMQTMRNHRELAYYLPAKSITSSQSPHLIINRRAFSPSRVEIFPRNNPFRELNNWQ